MAWKARVAGKTVDQPAGSFTLVLDFFDDADPTTTIIRKPISVPSGLSLVEIQTIVRAEGARERAKHTELSALDARVQVGQEVSI